MMTKNEVLRIIEYQVLQMRNTRTLPFYREVFLFDLMRLSILIAEAIRERLVEFEDVAPVVREIVDVVNIETELAFVLKPFKEYIEEYNKNVPFINSRIVINKEVEQLVDKDPLVYGGEYLYLVYKELKWKIHTNLYAMMGNAYLY